MSEATPPRGRPRSDAARRAILDAAFALLIERGFASLAIEAVAARAGVGKATIYRWWPGREALAVDAFFAATAAELAFPETGSGREDFRRQVHQVGALLRGPAGPAMAAMVAGALTSPALATALGERFVAPRQRWGAARLARAVAAGECHDGIDIPAALATFYAPLYVRLCFGRPAMAADEVEAYLKVALRGAFR